MAPPSAMTRHRISDRQGLELAVNLPELQESLELWVLPSQHNTHSIALLQTRLGAPSRQPERVATLHLASWILRHYNWPCADQRLQQSPIMGPKRNKATGRSSLGVSTPKTPTPAHEDSMDIDTPQAADTPRAADTPSAAKPNAPTTAELLGDLWTDDQTASLYKGIIRWKPAGACANDQL